MEDVGSCSGGYPAEDVRFFRGGYPVEDVGFFSGGYPAEDVFGSHMTFVYKSQTTVPKGHGSQISLFKRPMFRSRNFELIKL